jgi:dihydrofolate reductase
MKKPFILSLIVAQARNRAIGKDNDFPWHLSDDLKRFRKLTVGHVLIMGRGNYDHLMKRIGRMLPDRTTIVVTRNHDFAAPGVVVTHSLEEALDVAAERTTYPEVFVIGGAKMFESALPKADRLYVTDVDFEFDGDAYFPRIEPATWHEVSHEHHDSDERHEHAFDWVIYERI